MLFMNDDTNGFQSQGNNPFDPEAEWARSTDFQRHTLRFNGIWRLPYDFSLSGAYLFGSGNYYATTIALNPYGHTGTTRLNSGTTALAIPASIVDLADQQRHGRRCATASTGRRASRPARSRRATRCRACRCTASTLRVSKDINLPGGVEADRHRAKCSTSPTTPTTARITARSTRRRSASRDRTC